MAISGQECTGHCVGNFNVWLHAITPLVGNEKSPEDFSRGLRLVKGVYWGLGLLNGLPYDVGQQGKDYDEAEF